MNAKNKIAAQQSEKLGETSQPSLTYRNLKQQWAYITETISQMKRLREENIQLREKIECIIYRESSIWTS